MTKYRGWRIEYNEATQDYIARKGPTTIYGDTIDDVKRIIDWLARR